MLHTWSNSGTCCALYAMVVIFGVYFSCYSRFAPQLPLKLLGVTIHCALILRAFASVIYSASSGLNIVVGQVNTLDDVEQPTQKVSVRVAYGRGYKFTVSETD